MGQFVKRVSSKGAPESPWLRDLKQLLIHGRLPEPHLDAGCLAVLKGEKFPKWCIAVARTAPVASRDMATQGHTWEPLVKMTQLPVAFERAVLSTMDSSCAA